MQKILPSIHMLEIFSPVASNEDYFVQTMIKKVAEIPFYRGLELPVIFKKENQQTVRQITEEKDYQITAWASPCIWDKGYNLSNLDPAERQKAVDYTIELMKPISEMSAYHMGLPPGPDVAPEKREDAKKALYDSFCQISEAAKQYKNLHLTMEPLDRYVHKKQLMGPIHEVMEWFAELKKDCPNFYIHWDSAHEALAHIDLHESLAAALPYMAQFHICNCITDPAHPCCGDWHMELGEPPLYQNEGYLNVNIAADLLKQAAAGDKPEGIGCTRVAVEMRTHMGDDLWKGEKEIRNFLMSAFDLAGLPYDK